MANVLELKKPIKAHGAEISCLTFRDATGGDYMKNGYPFRVVGVSAGSTNEVHRKVDTLVIGGWICSLAEIPMSSVEMLSGADFDAAMTMILGFLA